MYNAVVVGFMEVPVIACVSGSLGHREPIATFSFNGRWRMIHSLHSPALPIRDTFNISIPICVCVC